MSIKSSYYPHKSSQDLRASLVLFRLLSFPLLVRVAFVFWRFITFFRFPITPFIRFTGYYQFCAGKDVATCTAITSHMASFRVKSVLDYANEHALSESDFDQNLEVILETIRVAATNDAYPFAVLKPTAIGSFSLFEKKSMGFELNNTEMSAWKRIKNRLESCAALAAQSEIVLMIDAEESWIQPGVDALILPLMKRYNKENVVLAITLQFYLKDTLSKYMTLSQNAQDYFLGVKFVRGAYMEKERNRAKILGLDSPVCNTKMQTDKQFRQALEFALQHLKKQLCIVATHNEADIQWVKETCKQKGIPIHDNNLWFSQLYGMRDYISFSLAAKGAHVFKYVPFGPLRQSIPYLMRRAIENSSVKSQTEKERKMLKQELVSRKINA